MYPTAKPPLVAHVIHALGIGGLENSLVNLINQMPSERYRHAIICMTGYTDFTRRIQREDVEVIAMQRGSVPLWRTYVHLIKILRRLAPAIVHSRNLSGLDGLIPAVLAGVKTRIHGEHGRDADDLDGMNPRNLRLRRAFRPLVSHYCAVSKDLQRYLTEIVSVPMTRTTQIYNGVDTGKFRPRDAGAGAENLGFGTDKLVIGAVGRLQPVKDHVTLVRAFVDAHRRDANLMSKAHLVIVGEGPCRGEIEAECRRSGIAHSVSLLGERNDVAHVVRSFDVFVLPSLSEGISNTLLEAMATGLPVLATRVGGNPELVMENQTGQLVKSGDWSAMADWIIAYVRDEHLRRSQGAAARKRAEEEFSMQAMVRAYMDLYDRLLSGKRYDPAGGAVGQAH